MCFGETALPSRAPASEIFWIQYSTCRSPPHSWSIPQPWWWDRSNFAWPRWDWSYSMAEGLNIPEDCKQRRGTGWQSTGQPKTLEWRCWFVALQRWPRLCLFYLSWCAEVCNIHKEGPKEHNWWWTELPMSRKFEIPARNAKGEIINLQNRIITRKRIQIHEYNSISEHGTQILSDIWDLMRMWRNSRLYFTPTRRSTYLVPVFNKISSSDPDGRISNFDLGNFLPSSV
jgi:hypothetical protein